jgi:hypothetical protein
LSHLPAVDEVEGAGREDCANRDLLAGLCRKLQIAGAGYDVVAFGMLGVDIHEGAGVTTPWQRAMVAPTFLLTRPTARARSVPFAHDAPVDRPGL